MRSYIAVAAIAALAQAQDLDWDAVLQATPAPEVTIPVVYATAPATTVTATTVSYSSEAAAASVSSALVANPDDSFPLDSAIAKRAAATTCQTQPTGVSVGPQPTNDAVVNDDSVSAFSAYPSFSASAASAAAPSAVPSGYVNTFSNLHASNNAYGYMGYTLLKSYDQQGCADKCTKINGCQSFNIYYERDPTVNPDDSSCSNPKSLTQIKCVFWSGPVTTDNANNAGQWRNQFQVVIAGSNGYVNKSIATPDGYNAGVFLDKSAINAPLDCTGDDSFIGSRLLTNSVFDANLCAVACNEQASYARQHPPTDGSFNKICSFFNTYILYKNGQALQQNCALYDQTWSMSYAKNNGYSYGQDHYTVGFSYTFSNKTDGGKPRYACDVASAKSAIVSASLQPYCSALLGFSSAASTQTITVTPTVQATTLTTLAVQQQKRAASTPAALQKYPASAITSGCALAASSVTVLTETATAAATTVYIATSTVSQK
ncbi:unnamed protein product [Aureobasidium uvarum]|uniref:Carbohydrate-binding-like protein n=1 Tax=Aureobasidium uvarum TaxID=2773716 RepID=A0A9N8KKG6_9PEZI|nr:unnamed protein product [Aureobasidium uvarum]